MRIFLQYLFQTTFFLSMLLGCICSAFERENPVDYLYQIHSKLHFQHGSLSEEYPEQLMVARFLPEDAKVLELGGNIGRNTCVIASILSNSRTLVSLETCTRDAEILKLNCRANNFEFQVENSALSRIPLIQSGWNTIPSNVVLPGYFKVNTITFEELQKKYGIIFDTLVADCEGALYYILRYDPNVLKNIKLIIIENDFTNIEHFHFVQNVFKENGFSIAYNQSGGWPPCNAWFYQVWKK